MATKPWRPAKSLEVLRYQINSAYPGRNKASDGLIGDAAHAKSKSEHNPDANGVVRALDITHDPAKGVDCGRIIEAMVASRDPRILYVIWNRRICSSEVQPWVWRAYSGKNKHDKHFHVSVVASPALYDNEAPWAIGAVPVLDAAPPPRPRPAEPARPPVQPGHDAGAPETAGDPSRPATGFLAAFLAFLRRLFGG